MENLVVFLAFVFFSLVAILRTSLRVKVWNRRTVEWIVDFLSLGIQGFFIPFFRLFLILNVLPLIWPGGAGCVKVSFGWSFLFAFVVIDYVYYWNHRILHSALVWRWHRVHHSAQSLDVFVSSRNSLVSHFLFIYVWGLGIAGYLIEDATGLWWGAGFTAALDLWRHSGLATPVLLKQILGWVLILPEDHEWHHSRDRHGVLFGANFNLWDRLHATFDRQKLRCHSMGVDVQGGIREWLFGPKELKS